MKGKVEEGIQVEDVIGNDSASKAKPISLGGGRGAFVNCKPVTRFIGPGVRTATSS